MTPKQEADRFIFGGELRNALSDREVSSKAIDYIIMRYEKGGRR